MRTACVIGGGTMGNGIAAAALGAGLAVVLVDVDEAALERARGAIESRLAKEGAVERAADLELTADLERAVGGVDVIIEAVPERIELKRDVFERLAASARDDALLATNTSTMSIGSIASAAGEAAPRVIGMHFFNPVHRMPLLEVVVADTTAPETLEAALALGSRLGKESIVVRDVPGFVTSRLGLLLGSEAMRIVEDGIASAADVDKAMKLGYRHPMGPLELADLVGLDARLNNVRSIYAQTGLERYRPPAILERLVEEGRLGRKSGAGFYDYDA